MGVGFACSEQKSLNAKLLHHALAALLEGAPKTHDFEAICLFGLLNKLLHLVEDVVLVFFQSKRTFNRTLYG